MLLFSDPVGPVIVAGLVLYALYNVLQLLRVAFFSPLRKISGPSEGGNFLFGYTKVLRADTGGPSNLSVPEQWFEKYGPSFRTKGFFCFDELVTRDTKSIQHIITHENIYQKHPAIRYLVSDILGEGVLFAEDAKHRLQRKVMNPAFGTAQIRELTETFVEKSTELRDMWLSMVHSQNGTAIIDAYDWLSKATLDVIGLAGFHYEFNALNDKGESSQLDKAFSEIFRSGRGIHPWALLQAGFPLLRILPAFRPRTVVDAKKEMDRLGYDLLRSSKAYAIATGEKSGNTRARDLLSLLVKSNMSTELPEDQRMIDSDVVAQVPTFLVAGHETTSTSTAWALHALALYPEMQSKLREELLSIPTDTPSMDELSALPYLDAIIRETLRLYSPISSVNRTADKDDVLPLSQPFTDSYGTVHDNILIKKAQNITISVAGVNRDKSLWGEDALLFNPDRWEKVPEAVSSIPGAWSHLLTFMGGSRACIGWKFSVVEMKALLFFLVRSFEFECAVPEEDISVERGVGVQRPMYKDGDKTFSQLPLRVKLVA